MEITLVHISHSIVKNVMLTKCANFVLCSRELSWRLERHFAETKGDISLHFRDLNENSPSSAKFRQPVNEISLGSEQYS